MKIKTEWLSFNTKGRDDAVDITGRVAEVITGAGISEGSVTVFVHGSTASVTTLEYEPGLLADIKELGENIASSKRSYSHDETWGDANGYSHLRASTIGPSLTIPVEDGKMTLGTWQQIVVIDHDNRPRSRKVVVQVIGK